MAFVQLSSLAELNQPNTSSRFYQKPSFGAPKIRNVSTWRITWLFLLTLSIPLNQSSMFIRLTVLQNGQPSANYQIDWVRILSVNRKSHVLGHVMIVRLFGAPKICVFRGTLKSCSINSTLRVEFKKKKGHVRSHVRCRGSGLTKVKKEERQEFLIRTFWESNVGVDWW